MPVPLVVVELPTAELDARETAALFDACSTALGSGRCEPAGSSERQASAYAVVSWSDGERLKVLVEVGRDRSRRQRWRSRELVFRKDDAASERSRTVGFTIASLAGEIEPVAGESPANVAAAERRPLAVSTGVLTGSGLDRGLNRLGASLRTAYFPARLPLFATVSVSYAVRSPDDLGVAVSWLTPGLGAGVALALPQDFALRLRFEGVAQRVRAEAYDAFSGRSETAARTVLGARAGLDLAWPEGRPLGALLFADLERLAGQTTVYAFGSRAGVAPATSYDFGVALELRFEP